ncbi:MULTISPECIES: flagellar protein export ATPase FliI [Ramlibacter]|uniref:Flagellum-specific ATP synthase n=1 Tax=Ramlibacter aquaticus TaxID=2780094 RepID=A0ABR9SBI0_9BURK|nr:MULTISPECIES: flagellar protein export ATPase FliI [Ramlibacter]MBE7939214.1 flagellar protein export ATPase FliI [Ramlibacter aquaticus]
MSVLAQKLSEHLRAHSRLVAPGSIPLDTGGRLVRVSGLVMEATGLHLPLGSICRVTDGARSTEAEVVGFGNGRLHLMPTGDIQGLSPGALVEPLRYPFEGLHFGRALPERPAHANRLRRLPMGEALLGRVIDPSGAPLDGRGPLFGTRTEPLDREPINAMDRDPVREPLDVGVRAINALLTVGRGQRLGLFAGSGVGKSVLMGMMARYTRADVTVVGLVGERGREVKEFVEDILGEEGLRRAVVVAAPADLPPLMRMQGASYATALAEYFRDRGLNVLLLMDSLTRYAMAHREMALALGEPPATKGYPPSVFARLPQLVERTGNGLHGCGSITAFYTVLTEGDDPQDPVADNARAILDGHIVLSRAIAEQGHYPAIDIEQSISRVMHNVTDAQQLREARMLKALYARYQRNRDLLAVGAYVPGADPQTDLAMRMQPQMAAFLQQDMREGASITDSRAALAAIMALAVQQGAA